MLITLLTAGGETSIIIPIDVVELVKAIFSGLATVFSAIAAGYAIFASSKAKQVAAEGAQRGKDITEVKENLKRVEMNTNSLAQAAVDSAKKVGITEGVQTTVAAATILAEGQQQGRELERQSHDGQEVSPEAALAKALPGAAAKLTPEVPAPPEGMPKPKP